MPQDIPKDFSKAIEIARKVFAHLPKFVKPGITEKEAARLIRVYLKHHGAKKESFRIIVASGVRSAFIHGFASTKTIQNNDILMFDFGALHKGYRSDITRTYVLGKPTKKYKQIYSIVRYAQKAAMKKVKAGALCHDVDHAARTVIEKAGYGKHFIHSTGHGICYRTHEPPRICNNGTGRLKAGEVITIEPGIYLNKWGGIRTEDMLLVTKTGFKVLSKVPYNLSL